MKLPTTDDSDRGQVGIGTLIIFIALVLVAAVAAGVLVNTAGELQSRASDTGSDAQAQVSNQIDVVSATGADDKDDGLVNNLTLVVKKSPGSDPIDLSEATIQYTSGQTATTLQYGATANATHFSTALIEGDDATILDSNGERVEIAVSPALIETADGLSAGDDVSLEIVDQSGASTVYGVNVPDVITGTFVEV
ncbi:archaellin/type IV pilin N-terminal domain-containing protein [Halosegnis marinus]|uniref:Flagellin n=1 Tax=Halosegnis marinus TaxID=3034023 RepID=A0ABD5ZQ34_9EURY|nr:archaellin/type IV pilin N-terminal domain-containing protein [Halosegnis sp. DT85]